jgi:hypothetical protein
MAGNNPLESQRKRPLGVTICGWYLIVDGVSYFLVLLILLASKMPTEKMLFIFNSMSPSLYDPLIAVGMIFLGKGLLNLREWARKVIVWLSGFTILLAFIGFLFGVEEVGLVGAIFSLIIAFIIFNYFVSQKVKEQFK